MFCHSKNKTVPTSNSEINIQLQSSFGDKLYSLTTFFVFRITAIHAPCGSKWLYVGTERGNTYIVNVETFKVSGYVILWNHVIDV